MKGQAPRFAIAAAVILATVMGFVLLQTSRSAKSTEFDRKRIEDLRGLAASLSATKSLPADLSIFNWSLLLKLKDGWSPYDPVTGSLYGYRRLDPMHFELCAAFDTAAREGDLASGDKGWSHPRGAYCFRFDKAFGGLPQKIR
jgi:hypothetical protein